jgi:SAM-dependent methyltransferase
MGQALHGLYKKNEEMTVERSNTEFKERYLSGQELYGDDFTLEEIQYWYDHEAEGYADKIRERKSNSPDDYIYDNLHERCCYRYLPKDTVFEHVLGFGSAHGYEFKPIASQIKNLSIIEPSDLFPSTTVFGIPAEYVKPAVDGILGFEDATFDMATCFGVLHHIPNVSTVMGELSRCLKPGGYLLMREPICSQGDWREARKSLTMNERGIPLGLFRSIIEKNGFEIVAETMHSFRPFIKLWHKIGLGHPYISRYGTFFDSFWSRAFLWNYRYHPVSFFERFTPMAVAYTLQKK